MDHQLEWAWGPRHRQKAAKKKKLLTERHMIEMRTDDPFGSGFHDWTLEALKALARRPRYGLPRVYQIGGMLSRVRAGAKLESLTEDSLRHIIAEVCDFDEIRLNHKHLDTHRILAPPCEILKSILTMDLDERKFPPLEVVASTPILGSDGKIINRPGYHRKDQLFLAPTIEIPPVPKRPTKQDVDQALALILGHYLEGFPIADDASKCHALSVVLTPLVRRLVKRIACLLPNFERSTGLGPVSSPPPTARTWLVSTMNRSKSIRSAERRWFNKIWWIWSQTPAACQSRKRFQQVMPQPQPIS